MRSSKRRDHLRFQILAAALILGLVGFLSPGQAIAGCGCCQKSSSQCYDTNDTANDVKTCERLFNGAHFSDYECVGSTCKQKRPRGEGCSASATSAPLTVIPAALTLTFDPKSNCEVRYTGTIGGIPFDDATAQMPLAGSLGVLVEPTADPNVLRFEVTDTSAFPHPPFLLGGHSIMIQSMEFLDQEISLDLSAPVNNVNGTYTAHYEVLIDGFVPVTVDEVGEFQATFDATTGQWTDMEFVTEFN